MARELRGAIVVIADPLEMVDKLLLLLLGFTEAVVDISAVVDIFVAPTCRIDDETSIESFLMIEL